MVMALRSPRAALRAIVGARLVEIGERLIAAPRGRQAAGTRGEPAGG
jgi:hypothetical protein